MPTSVRSFVVGLLVVMLAGAASGAAVSVRGKVVDTSGAVMPGASVDFTLDGVSVASVVANDRGAFEVTGLKPGEYVVVASLKGFKTTKQKVRLVEGETPAPLVLVIEVAAETTGVVVQGKVVDPAGRGACCASTSPISSSPIASSTS